MNIFNSNGRQVATVEGLSVYDLKGMKIYTLKGTKIYRLSGELVGHLPDKSGANTRLDSATEKLFSDR